MTEWRDVLGFEGLYRVSDSGLIEAAAKAVPVPRRGIDYRDARVLQPSIHPNGHRRVTLAKAGERVGRWVHRLVAEAFLPNPEGLPVVNHLDSDPGNNAVGNLEWTTFSGNTRHAFDKGRIALPSNKGEANSGARLTEAIVREIRTLHAQINNAAEVARRFGVSASTVRDVCSFRRWAHVK